QCILLAVHTIRKRNSALDDRCPVQSRQPQPVNFGFVAVCARQRLIDVIQHPDLDSARAAFVGWKHPLEDRRQGSRFLSIKRHQCSHAYTPESCRTFAERSVSVSPIGSGRNNRASISFKSWLTLSVISACPSTSRFRSTPGAISTTVNPS